MKKPYKNLVLQSNAKEKINPPYMIVAWNNSWTFFWLPVFVCSSVFLESSYLRSGNIWPTTALLSRERADTAGTDPTAPSRGSALDSAFGCHLQSTMKLHKATSLSSRFGLISSLMHLSSFLLHEQAKWDAGTDW